MAGDGGGHLDFAGGVKRGGPDARGCRGVDAGNHVRAASLEDSVIVGRQLRVLADLPDDPRLEAVDFLRIDAAFRTRRRRTVGERRARKSDQGVGRERVEMEGARGAEEPHLVLLDRSAEGTFDVPELIDAVGRLQTAGLEVRRQVVGLEALVLIAGEQGAAVPVAAVARDHVQADPAARDVGAGADVSGGGVRLNMIPRDGGNRYSGTLFSGYQNQSFQSDNLTPDLKARGLKTPDGIDKLWNVEGSFGGPIKKDKMWFFGSARAFHLNTLPPTALVAIPGTALPNRAPTPSTERGVDPQKINSFQARIVWQVSQNTKLSAYNDRILKTRGSDMIAGVDPATASGVWA